MQPIQSKMARGALGWGVNELAKKARLGVSTVVRFEKGRDPLVSTIDRLREAFETAGIIFLDADETAGPGVRLRK